MNEPLVRIQNLYKVFGPDPQGALKKVLNGVGKAQLLNEHGHVLGLNNINIDILSGRTTVIMGLSGSGKSTLLRHLNLLIAPTSGEVLIDGKDVTRLTEAEILVLRQTRLSMVFQNFALLPHKTVLANTCLAPDIRGEPRAQTEKDARRWLSKVGLSGYEEKYPGQLSGGMQQRVGLARALTSNADIMLMDEAFSALDPLIRTTMQDLLIDLQRELRKTIVFITHDLDEALKLADHLVILKDGEVVQQGDPQQVLLAPATTYVQDFVAEINRARVLRVGSVMQSGAGDDTEFDGEVSRNETLESLIRLSGGDTTLCYRVVEDDRVVGRITIKDVVRSLVTSVRSEESRNAF